MPRCTLQEWLCCVFAPPFDDHSEPSNTMTLAGIGAYATGSSDRGFVRVLGGRIFAGSRSSRKVGAEQHQNRTSSSRESMISGLNQILTVFISRSVRHVQPTEPFVTIHLSTRSSSLRNNSCELQEDSTICTVTHFPLPFVIDYTRAKHKAASMHHDLNLESQSRTSMNPVVCPNF